MAVIVTLFTVGLLVFVVPYAPGYQFQPVPMSKRLFEYWATPTWQHGMFVPLVAVALAWFSRGMLEQAAVRPSNWGMLFFALSLFIYWVGIRTGKVYFGYAAVQGAVGSLVIWFWGWRVFRVLAFPWAFLVFTWPILALEDTIGFPLRMLMSQLAAGFLNFAGIPTILEGNGLFSAPNPADGLAKGALFQLEVANPCSGINSLFALTMITAIYAYVAMPHWWQKAMLFAFAPILAVFGNFLRIIMLTLGTLMLGSDVAIGSEEHPTTFHMAAGFVVFAGALGGMVLLGKLIWAIAPKKPAASATEAPV
jgi:exosortase